ncbi:cupin domain-containing protein [Streptomyces sp. NPDC093707]|uniref:JmjC domain-containing protein n=1 Tax=Streptomyces sp. NPDC093707 TaxID=3154984 RepID=UPI0034505399
MGALPAALRFATRLRTIAVPLVRSELSVCHVGDVFRTSWLDALPLSAARLPAVTLIAGSNFERVAPGDAADALGGRTRSYENLHIHVDWAALASRILERALGRRVACAAYMSRAGDTSLGPHDDEWDGVIVQVGGEKRWRVWTGRDNGPEEIVTRVGDVLFLRQGITHDVSTPDCSLHLAFAVRDRPLVVEPPHAGLDEEGPRTGM